MPRRAVALLLAAGAGWESRALRLLGDGGQVTVLKRCVDVDDLLATASTGQADVAVVAAEAPGLDARALDHLGRSVVRALGVVGARQDQGSAGLHAARIGLTELLAEQELDGLGDRLAAPPVATQGASGDDVPTAAAAGTSRPAGAGPEAGDGGRPGRVVALWGPQGAPGRTTLACGLAASLARRSEPVVLVDADPWGGSVAQQLGVLDEVSGILAAARLATAGSLVDRFAGVQREIPPGVSVITGLPRPDRYVEVRAGTVEHVAETARGLAQVVLDTGFSLEDDPASEFGTRPGRNSMTLGALSVADEVLVVGSADPVGLSRLARALVDLRDVLSGSPVRVVINRNRSTLGWSERDVAQMVEGFAVLRGLHFLPEDRSACDRALLTGEPLAADSALGRGIDEVADAIWPRSSPAGEHRRVRLPGRGRPQPAKSR